MDRKQEKFKNGTIGHTFYRVLLDCIIDCLKNLNQRDMIRNINYLTDGIFTKALKDITTFKEIYFTEVVFGTNPLTLIKIWNKIKQNNPYFIALINGQNPCLNASIPFEDLLQKNKDIRLNLKDAFDSLDKYFELIKYNYEKFYDSMTKG